MKILSYTDWHDASACLLIDGKIMGAVAEERFSRIKHDARFPKNAINWLLESNNLTIKDIDYIAYPYKKSFKNVLPRVTNYAKHPLRTINLAISKEIEPSGIKLEGNYFLVDHHLAHAASVYRTSKLNNCNVLTIDWAGDGYSSKIYYANDGHLNYLDGTTSLNSLGAFYSLATEACGFRVNDGEFKVMGLAPYGKPNAECAKEMLASGYLPTLRGLQFTQKEKILKNKTHIKQIINNQTQVHFTDGYATFRLLVDKYGQENVAATAQHLSEQLVSKLTENIKTKTKNNIFALAGGFFLNVKVNKVLNESGLDIYPFPAAGDDGLVIGAALQAQYELSNKDLRASINNLYLGPEYSNEDIEKTLDTNNLEYIKEQNITKVVASLLTKQNIVAWFQGKMEFGPRALGSRSILADPQQAKMKDIINARVKFREPFRPFCPSMLYEAKEEYLEYAKEAPYMTIGFEAKAAVANKIPAVVHVDKTIRPQTVRKDINPKYWSLIKEFEKLTGIPVILNTSLNVRNEPIVCNPQDAVNFFKKADVDYLAIGDFLIKKS